MTPEDIAALADAVREAIESAQPLPPKLLFTSKEAHEITGLPVSFFEREAPAGHIPSRLVEASGGGVYRRYSLADLEAIVVAYEVRPTSGPIARRTKGPTSARRSSEVSEPMQQVSALSRDVRELAELLGVSAAVVYEHVNSDDPAEYWPHHRIGRKIRFTDADIEVILAKSQHQPPPDRTALLTEARILRGLQRLERDRARQVARTDGSHRPTHG